MGRPASAGPVPLDFTGPSLPPGVILSRASAGTAYSAGGEITSFGPDVPRFEHQPVTQAPLGLSVEPAASNIAHYAVASDVGWSALFTANTLLSLDAFGIFPGLEVAGGGAVWHRATTVGGGWAQSVPLRLKLWYQAGTSGRVRAGLRNQTAGTESALAGPVGALSESGNVAGSFTGTVNTDFGGGIFAVEATFTPNADAAVSQIGVGPFSVVAGETVVVLGVQLEVGSKGTSFIESAGSTADRAADVLSLHHWTGIYDVAISYSDGAAETRPVQPITPGFVLTPLAHRRVTGITLT